MSEIPSNSTSNEIPVQIYLASARLAVTSLTSCGAFKSTCVLVSLQLKGSCLVKDSEDWVKTLSDVGKSEKRGFRADISSCARLVPLPRRRCKNWHRCHDCKINMTKYKATYLSQTRRFLQLLIPCWHESDINIKLTARKPMSTFGSKKWAICDSFYTCHPSVQSDRHACVSDQQSFFKVFVYLSTSIRRKNKFKRALIAPLPVVLLWCRKRLAGGHLSCLTDIISGEEKVRVKGGRRKENRSRKTNKEGRGV